MTAKYFAILTNQGAAQLANAAALGTKLNLTQMAVGDANGTLPTPDPAQTKLINQTRIAPLNLLTVDPANTSQIIAEQIIPENEGGFWIREIGLYDDAGVLIAVANCPETYKPQLQEGSGRTQTIRMILIVSSTAAITLKIDPSVVLATRQYVDDKVIEVKAYADDLMKKHLEALDPHSQYLQKKNNLAELTDKTGARNNLGLKGAALRDVGRAGGQVMEVGAFGVGSATGEVVNAIDKVDLFTGFYYCAAEISGLTDVKGTVSLLQMGSYPGWRGQLILSDDKKRMYYRFQSGNTFLKPVALYSENNKPTASDVGALERTDFPVGIPQPWPTSTAPAGWLKCNGASFDTAKFPGLAAAYPSGKLPDLRGEFIRGWDDGRGVDSGRELLNGQGDAMRNINAGIGGIQFAESKVSITKGKSIYKEYLNAFGKYETAIATTEETGQGIFMLGFDASKEVPTAEENRPRNIAFNYIVRAA